MMGLTPMQKRCLDAIKEGIDTTGCPPSRREIAGKIGLASPGGVQPLIDALEERGLIRRIPNRGRAIEVVPSNEPRMVQIDAVQWQALLRYCLIEKVSVETAVGQFIRDGLENA